MLCLGVRLGDAGGYLLAMSELCRVGIKVWSVLMMPVLPFHSLNSLVSVLYVCM